ncbi:hypothetical protein M408DRAFT_323903 [Serendipita vermifera MAFF 305830]|uniref:Uncharacterized protein n=1 Tax=Serendipita vermifera MAFF 305830 TaxID=933852 RepID=A0A0C3ASJ5_SERVB|nr:hypothetical protein M408DRAFT_323903 [Serendipita vermifera MAFF 305830]
MVSYTCCLQTSPPQAVRLAVNRERPMMSTYSAFPPSVRISTYILPPELWGRILWFAVDASISPHEFCDYLNFPSISLHLQFPRKYALNSPFLCGLRLVCRTFNSLMASPYLFIDASKSHNEIGTWTRALYTGNDRGTRTSLQALEKQPYIFHQIVVLQIERDDIAQDGVVDLFDILCDNAPTVLPNVQTLIFTLRKSSPLNTQVPQFWARLNDAFPRLRTLSVCGPYLARVGEEESPVTFEHLRIIDLQRMVFWWHLNYPTLQHVSVWLATTGDIQHRLAKVDSLESLICQRFYIEESTIFDWKDMPRLRLLGMPYPEIHSIPQPPPDHPLGHLHILLWRPQKGKASYFSKSHPKRLEWLVRILKQFPNVQRFTFDPQWWWGSEIEWAREGFNKIKLKSLGVHVNSCAGPNSQHRIIVVDRLPTQASTQPTAHSVPLTIWKSLVNRKYL